MKDIQFNLQKWQTGEYDVLTRAGKEVTQLTCFELSSHTLLVGIFDDRVCDWNTSGAYLSNNSSHRIYDLFLRLKVKTTYYNVYLMKDGFPYIDSIGFTDKVNAKIRAAGSKSTNTYLKTIPVTNERE